MNINTMGILFVGGRFDQESGKPSKVFERYAGGFVLQIEKSLLSEETPRYGTYYFNGGNLETLKRELPEVLPKVSVVVWMPDVSNDEEKMLRLAKPPGSTHTLVMSKALYGRDPKPLLGEVMQRALGAKANLILTIDRDESLFRGQLLDPLGNLFAKGEDFQKLGAATAKRILELRGITRVGSEQLSSDPPGDPLKEVPEEFVGLVKEYAEVFEQLIMGNLEGDLGLDGKKKRFLGNSAFRCIRGFPAYRGEERIFVSRRNVEKMRLSTADFVPVKPYSSDTAKVQYWGEHKPSVDTPIQLRLFEAMPQIQYMLHGHVYLQQAKFTNRVLPCGALEEFEEIMKVVEKNKSVFLVNLKGHGFIAGARDLNLLGNLSFKARPFPEY